MQLPPLLADAIDSLAAQLPPRELAAAVGRLAEGYRGANAAARSHSSDDTTRIAYLVARLPATFAAVARALELSLAAHAGFAPGSLLDLGAGPGTAAHAARELVPSLESFTLVERDGGMIGLGRQLGAASGIPELGKAGWLTADLARKTELPAADLVTVSYALNELELVQAVEVVERAWAAARGALLLVEPGTPAGAGVLAAARVQLLGLGAHIAAPCTHAGVCPLGDCADRWCHFTVRLARSRRHRQAKGGTLGYEDEPFSFLFATRALPASRPAARIVSTPHASKAQVELELCRAEGIARVAVARRDGEGYRAAKKREWGDGWGTAEVR